MATTIFTQQPEQKRILVERTFAGSLNDVWSAWTTREMLDQWWAPKPWKAATKSMNFEPGGAWLYAMVGPDGTKHWSKLEYEKIQPMEYFSAISFFCDENGNKAAAFASNQWHYAFTANGDTTTVNIVIEFASEADLQKMVEMGFVEGFTMAHGNLDEVLAK